MPNAQRQEATFARIHKLLATRSVFTDADLSAATAAKTLGLSAAQFGQAIKSATGSNYARLIAAIRVRAACEMLRNDRYDDCTAEQIGIAVGFRSRQAFYQAFHRVTAMTPCDFRLISSRQTHP